MPEDNKGGRKVSSFPGKSTKELLADANDKSLTKGSDKCCDHDQGQGTGKKK